MKKKIIISSLIIGSTLSILPLNFIFNNTIYEEKNIEKSYINEKEEITNNINVNNDEYIDAFYGKKYSAFFYNNFTNPVISPNNEIPGFLGAWDVSSVGSFPTAIGWTTPDLYLSWSANLKDHPSLEGQVPNGFTPGLVTALHSDNKYSTENKNQVFAIVANTANLSAREYWILRYNTLDGTPIKDDNAKMPKMSKAPIPEMSSSNGNGSAFALANDAINNRYLAFYPGRLGDLKNDIFGFQLNDNNKIVWLENKTHFNGHSNWKDMPVFGIYKEDNIVLGLSPINSKKSSLGGASMALMLTTPPDFGINKYSFAVLNLEKDFAGISEFRPNTIIGRTQGVFNEAQKNIEVPSSLLQMSAIQKNINPNLQLFNFIDDSGNDTHKVQMVVPVLKDNEWIYMYLSSIFNDNNFYDVSWKEAGSLSQGSFFSSPNFNSTNAMPPTVSYNENNPQEILIVSNATSTDNKKFNGNQFIFDTMPPNGPWNPKHSIITSVNYSSSNSNWSQKQLLIRVPGIEDSFMWSRPNGLTEYFYAKPGQEVKQWAKFSYGGIVRESFQTTASSLQWLKDQPNTKAPSEITVNELETIGSSANSFFKIPNIRYPSGVSTLLQTIKLFGEPIKDDRRGIIQGIFTLTNEVNVYNNIYKFESKVPFKITGLNVKSDTPTTINQNNSILGYLPSELTNSNIQDFVDVIAAPDGAKIQNWSVTNQNNAEGTATISVDINPHFNDKGDFVESSKKITTDVSGLKKVSGTTAIESSESNPNLTVWEIDSTNASRLVEIKDLIPGSSADSISYNVTNQDPLNGELTVVITIEAGSYYDPKNKGLPSVSGGNPLELSINITGLKKIPNTGTLVIPGNGPYPGVFPAFINENNIMDFVTIENQVPGSTFKIIDIKPSPTSETEGFVNFKVDFDKVYGTDGFIINDPEPKEYVIRGLEGGITPKETKILSTGNKNLFSNTLAPEINESNINQFIVLVNLPNGVTPKYEFKNQKNTGQPDTGFQDISVVLPKFINSSGVEQNEETTIDFTIKNLKTIPAATSVTALTGNSNVLPESVSQVGLDKYLVINNASPIFNKESSIEVVSDTLITNNIAGTISFEYKLINAVTDFGFINESNPIPVTISGFQRGAITSVEQIGNFKDKKASEFELNVDNFFDYAKFIGYFLPLEIDEEGNKYGTNVTKIEKISFDDSLGTATFKATVEGGAIDQEGSFTSSNIDITFKFDGFEIVTPADNTIPIIAGAVSGGVVLIILIVVAIVIFNNKKNKKILNEKRKPTAPSAPPINSGASKSVTPSQNTTSPMGPARPVTPTGVARPATPGTGVVRPPIPPKKQ